MHEALSTLAPENEIDEKTTNLNSKKQTLQLFLRNSAIFVPELPKNMYVYSVHARVYIFASRGWLFAKSSLYFPWRETNVALDEKRAKGVKAFRRGLSSVSNKIIRLASKHLTPPCPLVATDVAS